jgi:hypothetical protein
MIIQVSNANNNMIFIFYYFFFLVLDFRHKIDKGIEIFIL